MENSLLEEAQRKMDAIAGELPYYLAELGFKHTLADGWIVPVQLKLVGINQDAAYGVIQIDEQSQPPDVRLERFVGPNVLHELTIR